MPLVFKRAEFTVHQRVLVRPESFFANFGRPWREVSIANGVEATSLGDYISSDTAIITSVTELDEMPELIPSGFGDGLFLRVCAFFNQAGDKRAGFVRSHLDGVKRIGFKRESRVSERRDPKCVYLSGRRIGFGSMIYQIWLRNVSWMFAELRGYAQNCFRESGYEFFRICFFGDSLFENFSAEFPESKTFYNSSRWRFGLLVISIILLGNFARQLFKLEAYPLHLSFEAYLNLMFQDSDPCR